MAGKIVAMVHSSLEIGQRLPPERELAVQFGVSRPTVREAILSLTLIGMLEVRKNVGVYVLDRHARPGAENVEGYGPFEMLAARQMIEPQVAAIAARQATPAILAQLADALATMRAENSQGREADIGDHRFHVTVAEATGNGALVAVCNLLWTAQLESSIWREIYSHMDIETFWPLWIDDHERIYEAIRAGDPKTASEAMNRHLEHVHAVLMKQSAFNKPREAVAPPARTDRKRRVSSAFPAGGRPRGRRR